jgi:hypothetical protein
MMTDIAQRIQSPGALGRAHRGVDLCLGVAATLPLVAAAAFVCLEPAGASVWVRTLAVIWSSSLLTFFAGVRRGLTFSEAGGGRAVELATMLGVFMVGVFSLVLVSPAMGAAGLAAVGLLDARSAVRLEAPRYFRLFRPVQMGACVIALALVQIRTG